VPEPESRTPIDHGIDTLAMGGLSSILEVARYVLRSVAHPPCCGVVHPVLWRKPGISIAVALHITISLVDGMYLFFDATYYLS
jgi:hypothetical protein